MRYRAGVIGCGRIGCGFDEDPKRKHVATHAGAYNNSERVEFITLADTDSEKLDKYGKKYGIPPSGLYTDYVEMLRKENLDIVSICTWSPAHREMVEKAVEAGVKAIFCEKPISDSLKDARKMVEVCNENNVILMIDHQRRFDRLHQEVKTFIEDGKLGRIQQAHVYYTAGIANTGSHVFDLLRFCLGDARYVQAAYSGAVSPNPDDPNIDAMVMFKSGALCMLQACEVSHYLILEFDFLGTAGRLKLKHSGFDVEYSEIRESHLYSGYKEIYPVASPVDTSAPKRFMDSAIEHLVECLDGGRRPVSSGEDGLAALELICAVHESASSGGARVTLPLEKSDFVIKSR